MHDIIFKMQDGSKVTIRLEGPEQMKLKNWWVIGADNDPKRTVVECLHLFTPSTGSSSAA